jgi:hypothetical protein
VAPAVDAKARAQKVTRRVDSFGIVLDWVKRLRVMQVISPREDSRLLWSKEKDKEQA